MTFIKNNLTRRIDWRQLKKMVVDFVYPKQCIGCHKFAREYICHACAEAMLPIAENACKRCSALIDDSDDCLYCEYGVFEFDSVHAAFQMHGTAQKAVHALKYRDLRALAPLMGLMMGEFIDSRGLDFDLIAPLPIHRRRERSRGYNQSLLLCEKVAEVTERPLAAEVLRRTRYAPPQVTLKGLEARAVAVADAFSCTTPLDGKSVLLIDDVVTTGNTVNEATKALKASGAKAVHVLSFTRGEWVT